MSLRSQNILLVTVDSLRADTVFGDDVSTPTFNHLIDRGVTYTNAFAQGPFTTFSMPSLFTSRYPSGLEYVEFSDSTVGVYIDEEPTIQNVLKQEGYQTAGFHSNPLLSNLFGFGDGFDTFDARLPFSGSKSIPRRGKILTDKLLRLARKHPYLPAEKLTQRALQWLKNRNAEAPFFLWLHYMDVHGPYQSKTGNAYLNKFRGERLWRKAVTSPESLSSDERAKLRRWYQEEVSYTDSSVGALLNGLQEEDVLDETIIFFTSDHGEQFGEHGSFSHPHQLYDELIHIPLVVTGEGYGTGEISALVELIQVAPTIAELAEAHAPDSFAGTPLPLSDDDHKTDEASEQAVSEADLIPQYKGCVRTHRWKYVREGTEEVLFDIESDPQERTDVSHEYEDIRTDLSSRLDSHLNAEARNIEGDRSIESIDIENSETEDRLRDLGYLE